MTGYPTGANPWTSIDPMLGQRLRRWPNTGSFLRQSLLFAGQWMTHPIKLA